MGRSWRGRIIEMGEQSLKVKITPLRGTPGGKQTAEFPKSSLSRHFRFVVDDLVLVRELEDGSFRITDLPWYKSPTRMVGSFLDIFSS